MRVLQKSKKSLFRAVSQGLKLKHDAIYHSTVLLANSMIHRNERKSQGVNIYFLGFNLL